MGEPLTSNRTKFFLGAQRLPPYSSQRIPLGLGRSTADVPKAPPHLPTPPFPSPPPLRQWRLVTRRLPSPTLLITSGRKAFWDWLRLRASSLRLSDWVQGARDASPDWLDQSACAAGFSVASHSCGGLPAVRTSRLFLQERSRLSGKAVAAVE